MDLKLEKSEIVTCDIDLISGEQSFESDILLPDYYQDIMKVLKCMATPVILKINLLADKVIIDGTISVRVYYQSIENKIKSISSKINFSKNFDIINKLTDNLYVSPQVNLDYINCRAINERKIDIKGALSIKVKLFCNLKESVLSSAKGLGLQIKSDNIKNMTVIGSNNNQFIIKEDIDLDSSKPDIGNIIRYDVKPVITEKKIIDNKVITKGDIKLKILYSPFEEDGENKLPESIDFNLAFNQIIDFPGLGQNDDCQLTCDLIWTEVLPKSNNDGRNRLFSVDFNFNIVAKCHKEIESKIVTDSYSTLVNINCVNKNINCYQISNMINKNISVEANISIPSAGDIKILDVWDSPKIVFVKKTDKGLNIEGKTELSILGLEGNNPVYIEKIIDFQTLIPIENIDIINDVKLDINVESIKMSYNVNYDNMDVEIDLLLSGCLYENHVRNVIQEIKVEDEERKVRDDESSLIVYYAQSGESIWELAKKYNTNISAILEENEDLDNDIISEKRMLLIPIVN